MARPGFSGPIWTVVGSHWKNLGCICAIIKFDALNDDHGSSRLDRVRT